MPYSKFLTILALFAAVAFTSNSEAIAQSQSFTGQETSVPIGRVVAIKGAELIIQDETSTPISAESSTALYSNDFIKTGTNTKALLHLNDGSQIYLGGMTALQIDWYKPSNPSAPHSAASIRLNVLNKGSLYFKAGLSSLGVSPDILINTPYGTANLKGTSVWFGPIGDRYGVFVDSGSVLFKNSTGRATLWQGDGIRVGDNDTAMEEPAVWSPQNIEYAMSYTNLHKKYDVAGVIANYPLQTRSHKKKMHHSMMPKEKHSVPFVSSPTTKQLTTKPKQTSYEANNIQIAENTSSTDEEDIRYYEDITKPVSGKYFRKSSHEKINQLDALANITDSNEVHSDTSPDVIKDSTLTAPLTEREVTAITSPPEDQWQNEAENIVTQEKVTDDKAYTHYPMGQEKVVYIPVYPIKKEDAQLVRSIDVTKETEEQRLARYKDLRNDRQARAFRRHGRRAHNE